MTLTVGSLFSGIGGLELGFHEAGFDVVFQVEKDPACRNILRRHWPDVAQYDDVTEVTGERLRADLGPRADVDVLLAGWPCQDISLAGRRAGLAGRRSGLFFEFARLVAEIAPLWIVAENVPGLLSSHSPAEPPPSDLPASAAGQAEPEWEVDETHDLGVVVSVLTELGYGLAWRLCDAQFYGVPQRRRRFFLVGHLGEPWSASGSVLFEPQSGEGDPEAGDEAEPDDATGPAERVGAAGGSGRFAGRERHRAGDLVSALTSSDGGVDFDMAEAGHLVPTRMAVGTTGTDVAGTLGGPSGNRGGFSDDLDRSGAYVLEEPLFVGEGGADELARCITAHGRGNRYDLDTENFVVEPPFAISMRGREEGNVPEVEASGLVPALRTGQGGSGNPMVVTEEPEDVYAIHNGDDVLVSKNVAQPVLATKGFPGAVTFRKVHRANDPEDPETWAEDDVANTLAAFENHNDRRTTHAIVHPIDLRQATRTSEAVGVGTPGNGWAEDGDPSYPVCTTAPPAVQTELSVRRLTPMECERLQGFPDGWTDKQHDSTRYKQLGNAVAVVVSRWIALRLLDIDRRLRGQSSPDTHPAAADRSAP